MKQRFENFLTNRSESDQTSPQVTEDIASIEKNIPDASVRGEILDTQLKKEELVSHLKDWRGKFFGESVDNNIESELGNRTLQHDADGYHTYLKGGVRIPLTEGQIASAKEWGVFWSFDDSVDKNMQQKTMSGQVRELIAGKYDEQLTSFGEQNRLSDDIKRDTYSRIAERSPELDKMQDGIYTTVA